MKILITRHGQTDWNKEGRIQGRTDICLNAQGKSEAKQVAKQLQEIPIDYIFCSPLKRAKQTAEIINENRNIPVIEDERLIERRIWTNRREVA